jgi:hypothetical protein
VLVGLSQFRFFSKSEQRHRGTVLIDSVRCTFRPFIYLLILLRNGERLIEYCSRIDSQLASRLAQSLSPFRDEKEN